MSTETLPHWPYKTYNWYRWPNDLGTLNLLGRHTTRRALDSVRSFDVFGLGAPLRIDDIGLNDSEFSHDMIHAGKYEFGPTDEPVQAAADQISLAIHGMTNSHIDALCHAGHAGKCFNGTAFAENVSQGSPATRFTIMDNSAIVTRAWFVDVPRDRGVRTLTPGDPVLPADLAHLEGKLGAGDALVVRTGRYATDVVGPESEEAADDHGNWSGLHVDCMEQIAAWDVSTVATDSSGDNFPSTTDECSVPIHVLAETYLGLPLIHHLDLESLAEAFTRREDFDFMLVVAPLRIAGGTGSPVSPTAIL